MLVSRFGTELGAPNAAALSARALWRAASQGAIGIREQDDMSIEVRNVTKKFGAYTAVNDVSVTIPSGKLVALLGPSGSGKTTLLRMIAGLEVQDSGSVWMSGADVSDSPARTRNVGFVFQHYALFKHMTVFDNIAFPLKVRKADKAEAETMVRDLLKLVRLEGFEGRYPSQLSGGQRQRVALARALAAKPKVLLLDEPFGSLDAKVRLELRQWLRRLHDEISVTSVFVTHDQEEALEVADRIVVMNHGKVEQEGTPEEIFEHPKTPFVMSFLGDVNIFHGRVENGKAVFPGLEAAFPEHPHEEAKQARAYTRPHELDIDRTPRADRSMAATVRHVNPAGAVVKVELLLRDQHTVVQANLSRERFQELKLQEGESVYVVPRQLRIFVAEDDIPPPVPAERKD
jgi:sulfate transport system ATP-binding protein